MTEKEIDILIVLEKIKQHPGLYLLKPNLVYLHHFYQGYIRFALENNIKIENLEKLNDPFSKYLQKELKIRFYNSFGWFGHLYNKFGEEEVGFWKFFEYLDKFKTEKLTST
jgi:hypothetical protein